MGIGQNGLVQQGYNSCSINELNNISNGLRFTPLLCMFMALIALYIQSPTMHFAIAALGIIPFWFPNHHPLDLFYNNVFRHAVGGVKLPANPLPRRIACLMGGLMNIAAGVSFALGSVTMAYISGGILIVLQLIVITTHFCVASWMYEGFMKLIGKWEKLLTVAETKILIANGALLIDVRNPDEYANNHLDGAINIPLSCLEQDDQIQGKEVILYCRSGMRSLDGKQKLEKMGIKSVYNFGSLDRWE